MLQENDDPKYHHPQDITLNDVDSFKEVAMETDWKLSCLFSEEQFEIELSAYLAYLKPLNQVN